MRSLGANFNGDASALFNGFQRYTQLIEYRGNNRDMVKLYPRGNFHSKTGEPVQGLFFLINWNLRIGVKQLILL